jgi:hypothetical protein
VQDGHIGWTNGYRSFIDFADETEEGLVGIAKFRCFQIGNDTRHQFVIIQ